MTTQHTPLSAVIVRRPEVAGEAAWLDPHKAGVYATFSAATIRRACNRHELQHIRVGHARGPILTRTEWLDAWMMRGVQASAVRVADEPEELR
jgi:hypothetical protein